MTLLLTKLLLAPLLVVGCSLAGRRWGPAITGMLVALPLVAGPILLITDLEHGVRFGARAAGAALLGIAALALFVVVFAKIARRGSWPFALVVGWLAFLAAAVGLATVAVAPPIELALAVCAIAIASTLMPAQTRFHAGERARPAWDLPARALATAALVLAITGAAAELGPALTGALAPFPIATSVLAAFVLAQEGPAQASAMLRGFLRGAFGFATFCFLVAILLNPMGTLPAFALALCGAISVQLLARLAPARAPAPSTLHAS